MGAFRRKIILFARTDRGRADIEAKDEHERTAAMNAACHGSETCLALIIRKGANLDAKDGPGLT